MAKIKCPGCKVILSSRRQRASCPWCGTQLASAYALRPFSPGAQCRIWPSWRGWAVAAVALAIAGCLIFVGYIRIVPATGADHTWEAYRALTTCQDQIKTLSHAGEVPPLPDAKNQGTYPEFYFVWPKDTLYNSPSDKDLNVPAATCRGDLISGRIVEVFMNGQDVTTVLQPTKS